MCLRLALAVLFCSAFQPGPAMSDDQAAADSAKTAWSEEIRRGWPARKPRS